MKQRLQWVMLLLVVVGVLSACGTGGGNSARESTLEAISAVIRETATYQASLNQNPDAAVETAQAEATAYGESVAATRAAEAALSDEAKAATATASAPILAELPKYGVDPEAGRVGWIHPPVSLDVSGYMSYDYVNYFIATVAQDFVVSGDLYWDTQYGTSGCGFVLRSNGNEDSLDQYMAVLTRGASGHLLFAIMSEGDIVSGRDIYAYGRDPNFVWGNRVTNRLTIVARGTIFTIYTNGTKIGEIDTASPPPLPSLPNEPNKPANQSDPLAMAEYQKQLKEYNDVVEQMEADYRSRQREAANANTVFERGFIALVVLSESGRSHCEFNNTWLWLIE
ncbi:MAG: hypothetical protein AB1564_07225 [Chloroflexota bacterium]